MIILPGNTQNILHTTGESPFTTLSCHLLSPGEVPAQLCFVIDFLIPTGLSPKLCPRIQSIFKAQVKVYQWEKHSIQKEQQLYFSVSFTKVTLRLVTNQKEVIFHTPIK